MGRYYFHMSQAVLAMDMEMETGYLGGVPVPPFLLEVIACLLPSSSPVVLYKPAPQYFMISWRLDRICL